MRTEFTQKQKAESANKDDLHKQNRTSGIKMFTMCKFKDKYNFLFLFPPNMLN